MTKVSSVILLVMMVAIVVGLGTFYSWRDRLQSQINLSASLPVPTAGTADALPEARKMAEPAAIPDAKDFKVNNGDNGAEPTVAGAITAEAVSDGMADGGAEMKKSEAVSVAPTAKTGASDAAWLIIGLSGLLGGLGLMLVPVVAVRR